MHARVVELGAHAWVVQGKIQRIVPGDREAEVLKALGVPASTVQRLADGQFLIPGLIDTHVHAPQ